MVEEAVLVEMRVGVEHRPWTGKHKKAGRERRVLRRDPNVHRGIVGRVRKDIRDVALKAEHGAAGGLGRADAKRM